MDDSDQFLFQEKYGTWIWLNFLFYLMDLSKVFKKKEKIFGQEEFFPSDSPEDVKALNLYDQ